MSDPLQMVAMAVGGGSVIKGGRHGGSAGRLHGARGGSIMLCRRSSHPSLQGCRQGCLWGAEGVPIAARLYF